MNADTGNILALFGRLYNVK